MRRSLLYFGLVLVLGGINLSILSLEKRLHTGQVMVLELAPRDPRAFLQGDYMILRYTLADEVARMSETSGTIYLDLDHTDQVKKVLSEPSPGSHPLAFQKRGRQVTFGLETYFFQEGQGSHFERARYAKVRVDEQGKAILLDLLDEDFRSLSGAD